MYCTFQKIDALHNPAPYRLRRETPKTTEGLMTRLSLRYVVMIIVFYYSTTIVSWKIVQPDCVLKLANLFAVRKLFLLVAADHRYYI
jgi:hypothetical protein